MKFKLGIESEMLKKLLLQNSYFVFLLLINVKMPTTVGIIAYMSMINFTIGILAFMSRINFTVGILAFMSRINFTVGI